MKYSNQTGLKSSILRKSEFTSLLNPKEMKWIRGDNVRIYKGRFGFVFTDGKREMVFNLNKPFSVVKPIGNARSEIKKVYQQNESVLNERPNKKEIEKLASELERQWRMNSGAMSVMIDDIPDKQMDKIRANFRKQAEKQLSESVNENKNVGHYERVGNQTIVDSNFVNFSKGVLPNSELVHLGMGDFALKTPKGDITFERSGKLGNGIGTDFVGRPHRITDDKGGKLVDELIKGMVKKKRAVLSMSESINEAKPSALGDVNAFGPAKVLGKGGKVLGFVSDTPNVIATLIQDYPNAQAIIFKYPFYFDFNSSYKSIKKGDKVWKKLMNIFVDEPTKAKLKKNYIQLKESVNEDVWTSAQKKQVEKLDDEFRNLLAKKGIEPYSNTASKMWKSAGFQKNFQQIFQKDESVNEANVVGKAVFDDGRGKLAFGYYKDDDEVALVDYKTWKKLNFKDVSKGDTNKDRLVKAILRKQKQFNKKVEYNTWSKKTNPSFEEKMDWFIKNGWISNVTKRGIKESVNERVFKDGKYRFFSKDGVGYLTYDGKEISSGDYDWEDGSYSFWMNHSSFKGQKAFYTGKDVINYFKSKKITTESVNEDTKKRFDVDFYKGNGDRQTSHEEIIRGDKFSDVVSQATKVAKSKGMNYVEFYHRDSFIGSIDKRNGYQFKKGRNYQKSPLPVNEGRAFVAAAKKAKEEGKTEFEFNGKTYPVTLKEEYTQPLYEIERGDIGYVEKHKSIATVYDVMGKKVKVKLGKTGKTIVIDTADIKLVSETVNKDLVSKNKFEKISLLKSIENGDTSYIEGVKLSPELAFELRMYLQRPVLARTKTGTSILDAKMKNAILMLEKTGIYTRLSSGVRNEFTNLLKKYAK